MKFECDLYFEGDKSVDLFVCCQCKETFIMAGNKDSALTSENKLTLIALPLSCRSVLQACLILFWLWCDCFRR